MPARTIAVTVAWATPDIEELVPVEVQAGASAGDAIERSGLVAVYGIDVAEIGIAIFGRRATLETPLADGDRIELIRALVADPRQARQKRAQASPLPGPRPRTKRHRN
jgi:uncharacterized protein